MKKDRSDHGFSFHVIDLGGDSEFKVKDLELETYL